MTRVSALLLPSLVSVLGRFARGGVGRLKKRRIGPIRRTQLVRLLDGLPPGRVLDTPSGDLWLSRTLAGRGFEVSAVDLLERHSAVAVPGIHYVRGDLNEGLPQFADGTFDDITCIERLEHLERPALVIREFARVLKPRGFLLLTTPNIVSLRSRLKFLLFGYFDGFRRHALFRCLKRPGNLETPHISPIHIQSLYYWLVGAGFTHIHAQPLPVHRLERLALLPLAALVTALGRAPGRDPTDRYQAEFLTLLLSRPLLFSPTVILTAQRAERADGGAASDDRAGAARPEGNG
jgi:SAM-dependent methyltransferase